VSLVFTWHITDCGELNICRPVNTRRQNLKRQLFFKEALYQFNGLEKAKFSLYLNSCITNYMPNNQFKKGELYSFITGMASTAVARRLQKNFKQAAIEITIEQWSVLYHLWKEDGQSQQELCNHTFRDKPSITRLVDNLEKLHLVKRVPSKSDRRINRIYLTETARQLQDETLNMANQTLNEALEGVGQQEIEMCKEVLQKVYDNLK
jgi:DNA-binding MarR family transcriptional regulator